MAFNLFGPPTKNDIRLGYIDPNLGYVEGFTICQANDYAIKNPGTTFIFRNGNNVIQYLNINEVNQLDPNVLVSTDKCGGINQRKECGPPIIQFFGGGGIGASGNPVIGRDGSLLAIDVVRGGNGYQYAPIVAAKDNCNYGTGATLTAILGEISETIETYENESDFEDYEICEPTEVGYGKRYGPNGEDLGSWEPRTYTDPGEDPIRQEVEEYERIVRRLEREPFWSTRSAIPTKITCSDTKLIPSKYNVSFPVWNDFMNTHAISPTSPSNVRGSDYAGRVFTFEWTEEFPADGEYVFRGLCDNSAQLYVNDLKLADLGGFAGAVKPIQKTFKKGIYNIRVDLLNAPITEKITVPQNQFIDVDFNVYGEGQNTEKINFNFISQDGSHSFNIKGVNRGKTNRIDKIKVKPNTNYRVVSSTSKPKTVTEQGTIKNNKKDKEGGLESSNKIFADHLLSDNDNDDMQIAASLGSFKPSNKRRTSLGRTTFDLTFRVESSSSAIKEFSTIVSSKSWNENPMGVAITIDAPEPPVPQEPAPVQEGRCPPNPIWTTRFPGAKETWYPVKFNTPNTWSKFMNRYAISPVKPLNTPGSDISGSTFTNSWDIDIPYDGFYGVQGTRDNTGRILIDGAEVSRLNNFDKENPDVEKVFITKGRHIIGVEVFNQPIISETVIDQKIFRTKDWQVADSQGQEFIDVDFNVYGQGQNTSKINFSFISQDGSHSFNIKGVDRNKANRTDKIKVKPNTNYRVVSSTSKPKTITEQGTIKNGKKNIEGGLESSNKIFADHLLSNNDNDDIQITASLGIFSPSNKKTTPLGRSTFNLTFRIDGQGAAGTSGQVKSGTIKDGVTYEGPPLFAYKDNRWGEFMNNHSVSPVIPGEGGGGRKTFTWKGVRFPESGQYDITFLADNDAKLIINKKQVLTSQGFVENPQTFKVNISEGIFDIVIDSEYPYTTSKTNTKEYFTKTNPTGFALVIRKNVTLRNTNTTPWSQNPVGISAILIPPPCPRKIRGRGVVTDVIVNDPGNGYLRPIPSDQGYPVALRLKEVVVENPGINYTGDEKIEIGNGAILEPVFGPFGKVQEVKVLNPGLGFTEYPEIRLISETGVNASFRPVFEVVRDPIILPEKLIQVTDLVGLKQTGYVDGRPYYGAVYYDQGVRFAGFYETVGDPVRVYDTLQESITAKVTTAPSAIQRQGTDITSNDPRLNIPGTPQDLI
jgi:hypothetical protein